MRLTEIKQHEIDTLGRRATKWADEQANLPPQEASVNLNEILSGYMEERGLQYIGSGAFSTVYGRPGSNRVVKVSHKRDKCWYRFANWSMRQRNNPHVPIIYHLESYDITAQGSDYYGKLGRKLTVPIFFAVMERLNPFEIAKLDPNIDPSLVAYFSAHLDINVGNTRIQNVVGMDRPNVERHKQGWGWGDPKYDEYEDKYWKKLRKSAKPAEEHPFVKSFKTVESKWKSCAGDLHRGNLMLRPSTGNW